MAETSSLSLPSVEETAQETIFENLNSYTFLYPLSDSEPESESDSDDDDYHSLPSENLETDAHISDSFLDSLLKDTDDEEFESEPDSDLDDWIPDELSDHSDSDLDPIGEEPDPDEFFNPDMLDLDTAPVSNLGELNQVEQDADSDLNPDPDWADTEECLQMDIESLPFPQSDSDSDLDEQFLEPDSNPNSPDETTDELHDCIQFDEQRDELYSNQIQNQNPNNQDQDWDTISTEDSSSQSDLEEMVRNLEWEVLLAVNNMYDDVEPEVTFFRQLLQNDRSLKGGPPASKLIVESLPSFSVSDCDLQCSVCKDSFLIGESVKRLPCLHDYHANCIIPWLGMRNTCPLCRYELATDDTEYDNWRANGENQV